MSHTMVINVIVILCLLFSVTINNGVEGTSKHHRKRVCYLLSGQRYRNNLIVPSRLKLNLCTHIIHGFTCTFNGVLQVDPLMAHYIDQINQLRKITNNNVTFLVSVGGGGSSFDFLKNNKTATVGFINSLVNFIIHYQLDGIDIDWEFPYITNDKFTFTYLIQEIRTRFDLESKIRHRSHPFLVTVALSPIIYIAYKSYEISKLNSLVDFVNLMTYDYHTPNTLPFTNHNAPLHANQLDRFYFKYFNVAFSANYIRRMGMAREKIVLGIPFYGYLYYLANKKRHDLYALSNGTQISVEYNKICQQLTSPNATRVFDRKAKVPYVYNGLQWISYDDVESVSIKAQWIVDHAFGGTMSFALNYDDHQNDCKGNLSFPLQSIIVDILGK